jgi:hypothetical protein
VGFLVCWHMSYMHKGFCLFLIWSIIRWYFFNFNLISHPTQTQWKPNQGEKKRRESKRTDSSTRLAHCGCANDSGHKFYGLTEVDPICCCLFILFPNYFFNFILWYFIILYLSLIRLSRGSNNDNLKKLWVPDQVLSRVFGLCLLGWTSHV